MWHPGSQKPNLLRSLLIPSVQELTYPRFALSRGIDIPSVPLVIHEEPTSDADSFVHRSGRTGRAGKTGVNVVLFEPSTVGGLHYLSKQTGVNFHRTMIHPKDAFEAEVNKGLAAIQRVPSTVSEIFLPYARTLLEGTSASPDAEQMLAKGIAATLNMTGSNTNRIGTRSHLTGSAGQTTFLLKLSPSDSFPTSMPKAHELIQRKASLKLPPTDVKITKDRDLLFDVSFEVGRSMQLSSLPDVEMVTDLPEMLNENPVMPQRSMGGGYSRGGGGRGGYSGGYSGDARGRGRFNGGYSGGGGGGGRRRRRLIRAEQWWRSRRL